MRTAKTSEAKRRLAPVLLLAGGLCVRCAPPPPVFPAPFPATVLPLRDPSREPDPSVLVVLPGRDGPRSTWMYVDSGVGEAMLLPTASPARLGSHFVDEGLSYILFVETPRQKARWGVVSSIGLADLVVREVPVKVTSLDAVHTHAGFIGQGILAQGPWEIDWDGGTLTLGASPWPSAPDVTVVPLRRADERDVVTLIVDGHAIDAAVDTGARYSMISEDAAKRAGLAARPVKDLAGSHEAITADVQLGALRLGRIELRPRRITGFGAFLGLDVLGGFGIQVLPGKQLALRPRGGAWESAARRLARWPWLRGCSSPGCVRAHAEAAGNDLRLTFSLEVEPPYPVGLLLGCADVEAPGSRVPTLYEALASHGRRVFEPRHVFVRVPAAPKDRPLEALIADGAMRWARLGCRDLSVLDVLPISEDGAAGTPSACFQEGTAGAPSACFTL